MDKVSIIVSIGDASRSAEILRTAQHMGLDVQEYFRLLGIIIGLIDRDDVPALRCIPGILRVEEEHVALTA